MKENSTYPRSIYYTTENTIQKMGKYNWKYRNLILLALSFAAAYYILKSGTIASSIQNLGNFGYPASFAAGMLFSYGLTTAPATVALFNLGKTLNPFLIAAIGACGTVISDYVIYRIVKDNLLDEIFLLSREIKNLTKPVSHLFFWEDLRVRIWKGILHSKIWNTIIPIIAGLIIASPLPDEFGAALFGAIRFEPRKFLVAAYVFNFIGIFIVAYSAKVI